MVKKLPSPTVDYFHSGEGFFIQLIPKKRAIANELTNFSWQISYGGVSGR